MITENTIKAEDLGLISAIDEPDQIVDVILRYYNETKESDSVKIDA